MHSYYHPIIGMVVHDDGRGNIHAFCETYVTNIEMMSPDNHYDPDDKTEMRRRSAAT